MQRDFNMQKSLKVWTCVRVKCAVVLIKDWMMAQSAFVYCSVHSYESRKCQLVFQPLCAERLVRVFLVLSRSLISHADFKPWNSPASDTCELELQACATMPHLDVLLVLNLVLHYYKLSHRDWWKSELHNQVVWFTSRLYISVHTSHCCHWQVMGSFVSGSTPPKERRQTPFPRVCLGKWWSENRPLIWGSWLQISRCEFRTWSNCRNQESKRDQWGSSRDGNGRMRVK